MAVMAKAWVVLLLGWCVFATALTPRSDYTWKHIVENPTIPFDALPFKGGTLTWDAQFLDRCVFFKFSLADCTRFKDVLLNVWNSTDCNPQEQDFLNVMNGALPESVWGNGTKNMYWSKTGPPCDMKTQFSKQIGQTVLEESPMGYFMNGLPCPSQVAACADKCPARVNNSSPAAETDLMFSLAFWRAASRKFSNRTNGAASVVTNFKAFNPEDPGTIFVSVELPAMRKGAVTSFTVYVAEASGTYSCGGPRFSSLAAAINQTLGFPPTCNFAKVARELQCSVIGEIDGVGPCFDVASCTEESTVSICGGQGTCTTECTCNLDLNCTYSGWTGHTGAVCANELPSTPVPTKKSGAMTVRASLLVIFACLALFFFTD